MLRLPGCDFKAKENDVAKRSYWANLIGGADTLTRSD